MKNLLIQNANNKFVNNIKLSNIDFCNVIISETSNNLYKLYYQSQLTHILFMGSKLSREEDQFIREHDSVSIFILNDTQIDNQQIIDTYPNIKAVIGKKTPSSSKNSKIINLPTLVNNKLYYNSKKTKNNDIVCFLDNIDIFPKDLEAYLYPHKKLPLKMFNNNNMIHPQNIGLLSEQDKADVLRDSSFYLAINEDYIGEAWACGCNVLDISELDTLVSKKYKISKSFQSYGAFLKGLINDHK